MNKVISVIRSTGSYQSKDHPEKAPIPYDNYLVYTDSGNQLFQNEILLAGEGKPTEYKIKVEDYNKFCKVTPNELIGKEFHVYYENKQLVQITVK